MPSVTMNPEVIETVLKYRYDKLTTEAMQIRKALVQLRRDKGRRMFSPEQRAEQSRRMAEVWRQRRERGYYEKG
jgi:hypothetical protein